MPPSLNCYCDGGAFLIQLGMSGKKTFKGGQSLSLLSWYIEH